MADLQQVTDASFANDIENSKGVVLLDFWAPWCGPCRAMEPILKELASENSEFTIAQMNVDENPATTQSFDVMSIPTFAIFKDGVLVSRISGGMPKAKLLATLKAV
jgi:thioredoxin 1